MPTEWLPFIPVAALVISLIALIFSGANLGWNIYKEIALRGRLRVALRLSSIHHEVFPKPLIRFVVSVTNLGPGKVRLAMLELQEVSLWRRLLRKCRYAALMNDYGHPLGGKMPYVLDVGEGMDYTFPVEESFMDDDYSHVGVRDTFGRVHWCSTNDMKKAKVDLLNHRTGTKGLTSS